MLWTKKDQYSIKSRLIGSRSNNAHMQASELDFSPYIFGQLKGAININFRAHY